MRTLHGVYHTHIYDSHEVVVQAVFIYQESLCMYVPATASRHIRKAITSQLRRMISSTLTLRPSEGLLTIPYGVSKGRYYNVIQY